MKIKMIVTGEDDGEDKDDSDWVTGEDDGENKDDSDWLTDNDSFMSDDGESDDNK